MRFILAVAIVTCFFGCHREQKKKYSKQDFIETKKAFEKINRSLVNEDKDLIEGYIKRHSLDGMKDNGAGLYYLVWGKPTGDSIKVEDVVEYSYKITLLDGTLCSQSFDGSPVKYKVGQGGVESGLVQALLLMRPGQKGKFILPPHLAYGLIGDAKNIPARSIIVYDIEMLKAYR